MITNSFSLKRLFAFIFALIISAFIITGPLGEKLTADAAAGYEFYYPVMDAKVSSPYGYRTLKGVREFHTGVDWISTSQSRDIYAVADGTIIYTRYNCSKNVTDWSKGFGNHIVLKLKDGSIVIYAHLDPKQIVKEGAAVKAGQKIAVMGMTGCSTGPHLHMELRPAKYSAVSSKGADKMNYGKKYTLNPNINGGVVTYGIIGEPSYKNTFKEGHDYIFKNGSGAYLGTAGNRIADKANVQAVTKANAAVFTAHYDKTVNGWIFRAKKDPSLVLNFYADSVRSGTNICLYKEQKKPDPTQYIKPRKSSDGTFRLLCAQNESAAIEIAGSASKVRTGANGSNIRAYTANNDKTQSWQVTEKK